MSDSTEVQRLRSLIDGIDACSIGPREVCRDRDGTWGIVNMDDVDEPVIRGLTKEGAIGQAIAMVLSQERTQWE